MYQKDCFINGEWVEGDSLRFISSNPANEDILWESYGAGEEQVDDAVAAAQEALFDWRNLPYEDRLEIVKTYGEKLEENKAYMAELISRETGKALWDAQGEVAAAIGKINLSIKAHDLRAGHSENEMAEFNAILRHKAHGVAAVFGPYNFPIHLPNGHIVPALLAGNTVVFKPSEFTPLSGGLMVHLWEQAGIPKGVLNCVQGEKEVGIALSNAKINALFFTGSSQTGKILHQNFAGRPEILLALEMGGNNPLIVSNVSDIDAACYHIIQSAFITSGQRCTCARRLIITKENTDHEALISRLVEMTKALTVGLWDDEEEPYMGPLVNKKTAEAYLAEVTKLEEMGGKVLAKAEVLRDIKALVTPSIVDVTDVADIEDEEIFAPLLKLYVVENMDEAIKLANDTKYGLSAGVISDDRDNYELYLKHSNAGVINFNRQTTGASGAAPFGGVGASGNHRPSAFYAADYCAYPIASLETDDVVMPENMPKGFNYDT